MHIIQVLIKVAFLARQVAQDNSPRGIFIFDIFCAPVEGYIRNELMNCSQQKQHVFEPLSKNVLEKWLRGNSTTYHVTVWVDLAGQTTCAVGEVILGLMMIALTIHPRVANRRISLTGIESGDE